MVVPLSPRAWLTVLDTDKCRQEWVCRSTLAPTPLLCHAAFPDTHTSGAYVLPACTLASSGEEEHRAWLGHFGVSGSCSQAREGRMMALTPGYIVFGSQTTVGDLCLGSFVAVLG